MRFKSGAYTQYVSILNRIATQPSDTRWGSDTTASQHADLIGTCNVSRKDLAMEDIHDIFTEFKKEFPEIYSKHEALGKEIHEKSGPLSEKTRWLIKLAVSGACNHKRALETHIRKAKAAGISDDEVKHALLLLIPTAGFPAFMKAFAVYKSIG